MTAKTFTAATCALAALAGGLAGCNQNHAAAGPTLSLSSSKSCTPFRTAAQSGPQAGAAVDPAAVFEECVHRWGYTLAPARDQADIVAQAVVDACDADLSRWNQQAATQNPPVMPDQASAPTMGPPTDMASDHARYAQERALFYVVQARAGNCAPPPPEVAQAGAGAG